MNSVFEFAVSSDKTQRELVEVDPIKEDVERIPEWWEEWKSSHCFDDYKTMDKYIGAFMDWAGVREWEWFEPRYFLSID